MTSLGRDFANDYEQPIFESAAEIEGQTTDLNSDSIGLS